VFAAPRESAIVDERAVVRLVLLGAVATTRRAEEVAERLPWLIDEQTRFGDVGRALPDVFLLRGGRIAEFSGLGEAVQICALADEELAGVADDEPVAIVLVPARA
jgi:N-methylhydantoinase A